MVFSEPVTGFTDGDVAITGTAGGDQDGHASPAAARTYNVAVSGMTDSGTVIATIPAGVASDGGGQRQRRLDQHRQHRHLQRRHDGDALRGRGGYLYRYWFASSDTDTGVTSSNGIVGASQVAGSTSTFTFTGTGVGWIGFPCEICGIANVYLDVGETPGRPR